MEMLSRRNVQLETEETNYNSTTSFGAWRPHEQNTSNELLALQRHAWPREYAKNVLAVDSESAELERNQDTREKKNEQCTSEPTHLTPGGGGQQKNDCPRTLGAVGGRKPVGPSVSVAASLRI